MNYNINNNNGFYVHILFLFLQTVLNKLSIRKEVLKWNDNSKQLRENEVPYTIRNLEYKQKIWKKENMSHTCCICYGILH